MYIFELLFKLIKKRGKKKTSLYNPLENPSIEESEQCEHSFMPLDSTGETLACIKCGFIVKKENINKDNYYE